MNSEILSLKARCLLTTGLVTAFIAAVEILQWWLPTPEALRYAAYGYGGLALGTVFSVLGTLTFRIVRDGGRRRRNRNAPLHAAKEIDTDDT